MINAKYLFLILCVFFVVSVLNEFDAQNTQETADELKAINSTEADYLAHRNECAYNLPNGECVALEDVGFIEQTDLDTFCVQYNCSGETGRKAALMSIIKSKNMTEKKIIFLMK